MNIISKQNPSLILAFGQRDRRDLGDMQGRQPSRYQLSSLRATFSRPRLVPGRGLYSKSPGRPRASSLVRHSTPRVGSTIDFGQSRNLKDGTPKIVFLGILGGTILFPFIGLLALGGKFDNAISWCTHGETHGLSASQRTALRSLLLAELIIYPCFIVTLVIYYAVIVKRA